MRSDSLRRATPIPEVADIEVSFEPPSEQESTQAPAPTQAAATPAPTLPAEADTGDTTSETTPTFDLQFVLPGFPDDPDVPSPVASVGQPVDS